MYNNKCILVSLNSFFDETDAVKAVFVLFGQLKFSILNKIIANPLNYNKHVFKCF